jgi:hypothetical protein
MRMRVIAAAVIVAFLAGPAFAQQKPIPKYGEEDKEKSAEEKNAEREADRAYKRSLGNIPEQKPVDPWGNVRIDNSQKPEAKAPAKKTKTGTTSN